MDWYEKYSKAAIAIEDRESLIDQCYEELEQNLTLIGCSAIEDKLQDEVPETIETLSKAGIKIWMLTGDKLETAVNIGRSCNLLSDDMFEYERLIILDIDESLDDSVAQSNILSQIQSANENINSSDEFSEEFGLVVSGKALGCILSSESSILESFIDLCINCKSVICCRISPKQKSSVVSMIKDRLKGKVTLSIGDGANDVPMIRSAHVGIGIIGKEGLQAVMASDYAISQFKFLQNLLLVHGQWSYRRISVLICYSFYKNVIASIINICFAFVSAFSGQIYYDATISSGYNLIFTSVPVLFVSVFNRDHPKNILLTYPDFYKTGQKNSFLNLKILWFGNLKAIFSSIVIFLFTYFVYNGCGPLDQTGRISSFFSMSTTSFTALFLVVTLKISLDTKTWVFLSHIGIWGSLIVWFASVAVLSNLSFYMDFNGVFEEMYQSPTNWFLILLSTVTCIIPDIIEI
jgi:phospholipid-transporting ATPase